MKKMERKAVMKTISNYNKLKLDILTKFSIFFAFIKFAFRAFYPKNRVICTSRERINFLDTFQKSKSKSDYSNE